jgi:hypothetical protein
MKRIANVGIGLLLSVGLLGLRAGAQTQDQSSTSGSSLGDYARQIRKAPATGSKPKVFDNDNLPTKEKLSIIGPGPEAVSGDNTTETKPPDSAPAAPATGDAKASTDLKPAGEAKPSTEVKAPDGTKVDDGAGGKGETKTDTKASTEEKSAAAGAPKTAEEDTAQKQAAWKQWGDRLSAQLDEINLLTRELDVLQREYQIRAAAMYGDVGNRLRNETNWDKQDAQYKQQIADKQKALDDAKQKLEDMQEEARKAGVPASVREP